MKLSLGDKVRVKRGVEDPDFPDLKIASLTGEVIEVREDTATIVLDTESLKKLDIQSLEKTGKTHKERCKDEYLGFEEVTLQTQDLSKVKK